MTFVTAGWRRSAPWMLGTLLALGLGTSAALAKGQVTGKVVDAEGKAVVDVTIRFTFEGSDFLFRPPRRGRR